MQSVVEKERKSMLKAIARYLLRKELDTLNAKVSNLSRINKKVMKVSMEVEIPENTDLHVLRERIIVELESIPVIISVENLKYSSC